MKLIAKTIKGKEFLHSRTECAFVSNSSAEKICKIMNDTKFRLKSENEIWHTYDYDFTQDLYVSHKLTIYKGIVKLKVMA